MNSRQILNSDSENYANANNLSTTDVNEYSQPRKFRNNTDIAELYPHAKTYEELRDIEKKRSLLREQRLPKHAYIIISVYGSVLSAVILVLAINISNLWRDGNIGLIFFSFLAWLVVYALLFTFIRYTNNSFNAYSKSSTSYWLGYSILGAVEISALSVGLLKIISFAIILSIVLLFNALISTITLRKILTY